MMIDQGGQSILNPIWAKWFTDLGGLLAEGHTEVVVTAALTGGGTEGSLTFHNGVLTDVTPAT